MAVAELDDAAFVDDGGRIVEVVAVGHVDGQVAGGKRRVGQQGGEVGVGPVAGVVQEDRRGGPIGDAERFCVPKPGKAWVPVASSTPASTLVAPV